MGSAKARVVVTGIGGFTGPYVRAALEESGYEVHGLSHRDHGRPEDQSIDLLDAEAVNGYFKRLVPDYVVHLAGISFVAHERAADQYMTNLLATVNLVESILGQGRPVKKVILASSSNVYGRPARLPVDESASPAPLSDYAISKYAMELMAQRRFDRLPILIVRPFNYTGIGQSANFVLPKLVKHFREKRAELELGNTAVVREFMDVRDVARIYVQLLASDVARDVVNVCCGVGHRLGSVVEKLIRLSGHQPQIRSNKALFRANEIDELVGSPDKLVARCGRISFHSIEETLSWMLVGQSRIAAEPARSSSAS